MLKILRMALVLCIAVIPSMLTGCAGNSAATEDAEETEKTDDETIIWGSVDSGYSGQTDVNTDGDSTNSTLEEENER